MTAADGRNYTIGELQDLIAAKDVNTASTLANEQKLANGWSAGSDSQSAWQSDWAKMIAQYNGARSDAQRFIEESRIGVDVSTLGLGDYTTYDASSQYQAVLQALNPSWPGNWGAGSFNDLSNRLAAAYAAAGQTQPVGPIIPQPTHDSGLNPNSWQGYMTGIAVDVGLVSSAPPGTPLTNPQGLPDVMQLLKPLALVVGVVAGGAIVISTVINKVLP